MAAHYLRGSRAEIYFKRIRSTPPTNISIVRFASFRILQGSWSISILGTNRALTDVDFARTAVEWIANMPIRGCCQQLFRHVVVKHVSVGIQTPVGRVFYARGFRQAFGRLHLRKAQLPPHCVFSIKQRLQPKQKFNSATRWTLRTVCERKGRVCSEAGRYHQ